MKGENISALYFIYMYQYDIANGNQKSKQIFVPMVYFIN